MTCSNCGSPLDKDAAFCGNCGRALVANSGAPAAAPPPVAPSNNVAYAVPGDPAPPSTQGNGQATAAMVLGIISLIAWLIPLIGIPVTTLALLFGIRNRKSGRKGQAVAGIVMGCISVPLIIFAIYINVTTK